MNWPMCAVCNKPVDRLEADRDVIAGTTTFTVMCHGVIDSVSLTDAELAAMSRLDMGVAFTTRATAALEGR